jgi:hypothetical protein
MHFNICTNYQIDEHIGVAIVRAVCFKDFVRDHDIFYLIRAVL